MSAHDPRHEQMARRIGARRSWSAGPWWTDGYMILRTSRPFTVNGCLEMECDSDQAHAVGPLCEHAFVDAFTPGDPTAGARKKLLALIDTIVPVPIALSEKESAVPVRRATAADGRWWAFQARYIAAVTRYCRPDAWAVHQNDMLVARRRGEVVAVVMALWVPGSATPKPAPKTRMARAVGRA